MSALMRVTRPLVVSVKAQIIEKQLLLQQIRNKRKEFRILYDRTEAEIAELVKGLPKSERPRRGRPTGWRKKVDGK